MNNLRLCLVVLACCLFSNTLTFAQKAKFKSKLCAIQKTRLPKNFTPPENRTYDIFAKGRYSGSIDTHNKKGIYGWERNSDNPQLKAVVSVYGFSVGSATRSSEKKQETDKDGKVIDSWTEYNYSGTARGKATLYIYGVENKFQYKKSEEEKSAYEKNKEAKAASKKKELEANPFLSSEDVEDVKDEAKEDIGKDTGLEAEKLALVRRVGIDQYKSATTDNFRSSTEAFEQYDEITRPKLWDFRGDFPSIAYDDAVSNLNYLYGYTPTRNTFYLKRMKSEKHPEFEMWNNACQATETLFKGVRYNKSIATTQKKFEPIVKYFIDVLGKTSDSDKKSKKLRRSAFSNLTNILYYLDKHDVLIDWCKDNLESKYLGKSAKRMLKSARRKKALLEFHQMESCHNTHSAKEASESDMETEKSPEEGGTK